MIIKFIRKIIRLAILSGIVFACTSEKSYEIYYPLKNQSWNRFNILRFEIPITQTKKTFDVYFSANITRQFEFEDLIFNMVMNTPTGEERINEYQMKIKSPTGTFLGQCQQDSCINKILLKKNLLISKAGILTIEIENLTPRIVTPGVLGIGISLLPSEQ